MTIHGVIYTKIFPAFMDSLMLSASPLTVLLIRNKTTSRRDSHQSLLHYTRRTRQVIDHLA